MEIMQGESRKREQRLHGKIFNLKRAAKKIWRTQNPFTEKHISSRHFQICNAQSANQHYLGAIEAFQKRDKSKRTEQTSVPPLPVQRKGDNPFIPVREQLKGIIRTGIAEIAPSVADPA